MPVIIVVIFWKVLPGEANRLAFFDHWAQTLELNDRSRLVGEYLSRPMSEEELSFPSSLLGVDPGDEFVPFFNFGVWETLEAFEKQVIEPFVGAEPEQKDFEYALRERMILSPQQWRVGDAHLPNQDHLPMVERDPERGRAAAAKLKGLGARKILVKAAEQGYITQAACKMPECFCPEELGGACYFEPVTSELSDWMPTVEHYPLSRRAGGKETVGNVLLAHRLCNRIDYSIRTGRSYASDLERIRNAREKASD